MKIQIREGSRCFTIPLPSSLFFSRFVLRKVLGRGGEKISPAAADRLCRELRRLSRQEDPWELVRVESKNGDVVSITL